MNSKLVAFACCLTMACAGLLPVSGAEKVHTPFAVGQKWFYTAEGKEAVTPLRIIGAGVHAKAGPWFDLEVKPLPKEGDWVTPLFFLRVSKDALERSVTRQVEGYFDESPAHELPSLGREPWIYDKSVEEALRVMDAGMKSNANQGCEFDREKMLALDQNAFDQDMNGGWRKLGNTPKCQAVAADLIRDYRAHHKNDALILYWHEGQTRAGIGQNIEAIALFEKSRHVPDNGSGWNQYVDATVAFLHGDRKAFDAARKELASLPRQAGYDLKYPDGREVPWPMNLEVVDGLGKCFDKSYNEAYGTCRD